MTETFWLTASIEHRRAQARVWKQLADTVGRSMDETHTDVFGTAPHDGSMYWDNVRAGRMSRKKSARLHAWMRERHPEFARRLDNEVGVVQSSGPLLVWRERKPRREDVGRESARKLTADDDWFSIDSR